MDDPGDGRGKTHGVQRIKIPSRRVRTQVEFHQHFRIGQEFRQNGERILNSGGGIQRIEQTFSLKEPLVKFQGPGKHSTADAAHRDDDGYAQVTQSKTWVRTISRAKIASDACAEVQAKRG